MTISACRGTHNHSENDIIRNFIILNSPEIQSLSDFEQISALVNLTHQSINIKLSDEGFASMSPLENLQMIFQNSDWGHLCGGIAITARDILSAFGHQARLVQGFYYSYTGELLDGHVALELLFEDKWVAIDPTFNVVAVDENNEPIDFRAMKIRASSGAPLHWVELGPPKIYVNDYWTPYENLIQTVRILPSDYRGLTSLDNEVPGQEILVDSHLD